MEVEACGSYAICGVYAIYSVSRKACESLTSLGVRYETPEKAHSFAIIELLMVIAVPIRPMPRQLEKDLN